MLKKIPLFLLCMLMISATASLTMADNENVIYETDFSVKDEKWNALRGNKFNILNGKLEYNNSFSELFPSIVVFQNDDLKNGHVNFDLKFSDSKDFSLIFKMSDENNYYKLTFSKNKASVLKRVNGGSEIIIKEKGVNLAENKLNNIDVAMRGIEYDISVNNEKVLSFTDESHQDGNIGFSAKKGKATIDNFKIYEDSEDKYTEAENSTESIKIYVSPIGNDELGNGTEENPYKTFEKAKEIVRIAKSEHRPIDVIFAGGEYEFTKGLVFETADSGEKIAPITYKAKDGEEVVFNGSKKINPADFNLVTDEKILSRMYESVRGKVYQVDLASQGFKRENVDFKMLGPLGDHGGNQLMERMPGWQTFNLKLIVNGRIQNVSRWPNNGYAVIYDAKNGDLTNNDPNNRCTIYFNSGEPLRWGEAKHAIASGNMSSPYFRNEAPIEKVDTENMSITLGFTKQYGTKRGMDWSVINLLEEIDIPGEWYIDYDTMIMYYYPEKEILSSDTFEIPYLKDSFIELKNGVQYVNFENLDFANTNTKVSKSSTTGHGMLIGNLVDFVNIKGCSFRDMGGAGIKMQTGSDSAYQFHITGHKSFNIDSCNFYRCFRTAMDVGTGYFGGLLPTERGNLNVTNCYIYDSYMQIVNRGTAYGGNIKNNLFSKQFGEFITGSLIDGEISYNEMSYGVYDKADMGCIYAGRSPVSAQRQRVNYNLIHHYGPDRGFDIYSSAIYYDDQLCGMVSIGNMMMAKRKDAPGVITTGIIHSGGSDLIYEGNISVNAVAGHTLQNRLGLYGGSSMPYKKSDAVNAMFLTNKEFKEKFPWVERYKDYMNDDWKNVETNSLIQNNLATDCVKGTDKQGFLKPPYPTGINDDAIEINDKSIYVDYDNLDFRITSEAKEKYNLADVFPCEDNFDINSVGIQRKVEYKEDILNFNLTMPENNEVTPYYNSVQLSWQYSDATEEYEYIVSKDKEFSEIVASGKTVYTNALIKDLEPDTTYYWKVIARSYARTEGFRIENADGVRSFKTSGVVKVENSMLKTQIDELEKIKNSIKESSKIGEYASGSKKLYTDMYNKALAVFNDKSVTQTEVDNTSAEIMSFILNDDAKRNVGFVSLKIDPADEYAKSKELIGQEVKKGEATFETGTAASTVTIKKILSNNEIQSFKVNAEFDAGFVIFALRKSNPEKEPWNDAYYALIKPDVIELQIKGKILQVVDNDGIFERGKWHDVSVGAIPTEGGVNLYFSVDGEVIFDYLHADKQTMITSPGYFSVYIPANSTVSIKNTENVQKELYTLSDEIKDYIENGVPVYFDAGSTAFKTTKGAWEKTGFKAFGIVDEVASSDKDCQAQWTLSGDNKEIYKIYYYNNPSPENDSSVDVRVEGRSRLYEGAIDLTKGSEGWTELCEFEMTSDGGDVGYAAVTLTGSGNGKVPMSRMMIRKVKD